MPNAESFQLPQELLIVGAATQAGLFDAIKNKPSTLRELVDVKGSDYRALWTVTEALVSMGYIEYHGSTIKLTAAANSILYDEKSRNYTGFSFMHTYNLISRWLELPEIMSTGTPSPQKRTSEEQKNFITAMSSYAQEDAPEIAEYCLEGFSSNPEVLDVGGGPLTFARALARQGAVVTVLDLPDVIEMLEPELDPGLPIRMVKGDFTSCLPNGPYDVAYLGNVCHIYGEEKNKKLFADVADKLRAGGRLVINEFIRGTGPDAAIFAVNMLVNTSSGGTWTYEQYKSWLQDAGFTVFPWVDLGNSQLIKAHKL